MRRALTITAKDLRQRLRDRTAIVMAVLVPFALAWIFSLTLSGVSEGKPLRVTYAVVDQDHGELAAGFQEVLSKLDFVKSRAAASIAAASQLAKDGDVDAAFVIPAGFSDSAARGQGGELRVIENPNSDIGSLIARSLAESFASDVNGTLVSVNTVLGVHEATPDPAAVQALVERARATAPAAVLDENTAANRVFSSTTFYAAGMAVFFVFFTVEFGVRSLLEERQNGTLARLLVAPLRPGWIITGKALSAFVVGLGSMVTLVVASTFLLGASWGDPVGVMALVLSAVVAAMGLTALVATLAKTAGQASAYASVAAVVLGLLGGTFFPLSQAGFLSKLTFVAPHAWLMRGFGTLAGGGSGLVDVLPSVGAVLAFGVVTGGIALARSNRLVPR